MRINLTLLLLTLLLSLRSQSDFILTKTNDTVKVDIKYWTDTKIVCKTGSGDVKYRAKDIIGFQAGNSFKESARVCPTLIGFKKYMFLTRLITGKINIYCISVTDRFTDRNKNGSTTITTNSYVSGTVAYARKSSTAKYKKLFGYNKVSKMMDNCDAFNKRFPNSVKNADYPYIDAVEFYNEKCK